VRSINEADVYFLKVEVSLKRDLDRTTQQRQKTIVDVEKLLREGPRGHGLEIDVQIIAPDG
jgi:hypothetical protein